MILKSNPGGPEIRPAGMISAGDAVRGNTLPGLRRMLLAGAPAT